MISSQAKEKMIELVIYLGVWNPLVSQERYHPLLIDSVQIPLPRCGRLIQGSNQVAHLSSCQSHLTLKSIASTYYRLRTRRSETTISGVMFSFHELPTIKRGPLSSCGMAVAWYVNDHTSKMDIL